MKKMKSHKGFTATVDFDAEEMLLHGRIDNIRDVVTFHADSVEQLESRFREAVDDYLNLCSERGEQPDRPYSGRFVVRLGPDQHRRAALSADRKGVSLNTWIVEALDAALSSGENPRSAHATPGRSQAESATGAVGSRKTSGLPRSG
jgi:predicted HicB family RNase H-like nuclease